MRIILYFSPPRLFSRAHFPFHTDGNSSFSREDDIPGLDAISPNLSIYKWVLMHHRHLRLLVVVLGRASKSRLILLIQSMVNSDPFQTLINCKVYRTSESVWARTWVRVSGMTRTLQCQHPMSIWGNFSQRKAWRASLGLSYTQASPPEG